MPVTPTGPLAVAIDSLRTLISNVPFFQTWVSAGSAAAALANIFTGEVGFPIGSISITANVLTVNTREPNTLAIGQTITIEGGAIGPQSGSSIDGVYTVVSTPTATAFTVATALANTNGQLEPDQAFILPCARPIAIVCESEEDGLASDWVGTGGAIIWRGGLDILLEADVSSGNRNDPLNAKYEATNAIGEFVQGLQQTQDTGDLMVLRDAKLDRWEWTQKAEQDDNQPRYERWRAIVRVKWGMDS